MLEYVTEAEACCDSTVAGTPDVAEQGPRETPGVEGLPLVGYYMRAKISPGLNGIVQTLRT